MIDIRKWLILLLAAVIMLASGCSKEGYKTVESALQNAEFNDIQIVHIEEVESDKVLVFYETKDRKNFGCGLVSKSWTGWHMEKGELTVKPESEITRGLVWASYDFPGIFNRKFSVIYGIITNPNIKRVELKTSDNKPVEAKLVTAEDGTVIWYTAGNKSGAPKEIKGIASSSQLLYYYPHKVK